MNALEVDFPDASFDIVYCVSSVEHFGGLGSAARAVKGMARVLRPGGHLVITTECLVGHHPLDWPPLQFAIRFATLGRRCETATPRSRATETFTPRELERYIVEASGLELVQPLKTEVSSESYENLARWAGDSEPVTASGDRFPHIMLQAHGAPWTSVFLALRKPA
jgi:SAM-dependent methyltransferase